MAAFAVIACQEKEEFVPHLDFPPTEVTIPTAGTEELAEPFAVEAWDAEVEEATDGVAE